MPAAEIARVSTQIDQIYRKDSRRIFATLIRLLGDFERAEEALHEAFRAAMEKWPAEGLPQNPVAWLVSAGRFKSIDKQRRDQRFEHLEDRPDVAESLADQAPALDEKEELEDDRLRLVFTCCHPALASDAQVALTLREVCGLATEEIAAAFLTPAPTIAQRIVRAKSKIRDANIPYQVPARDELPERLESVLRVVYLVFNEGYSASSGDSATRADLSGEAIRLGRLIVELIPEPEAQGLLALMLLHESRRETRATPDGELILLDEQDRSRWNRAFDRRGRGAGPHRLRDTAPGTLRDPGGDRGGARGSSERRRHRLARDRGALRPAAADHALARRRAQPHRGARHARWARGRPRGSR